jgi:hypothetical protein
MDHKRMAGRYSTVVKDGSNFTGFSGLCQAIMFLGCIKDFQPWWDCTGMELTAYTCLKAKAWCCRKNCTVCKAYEVDDEAHYYIISYLNRIFCNHDMNWSSPCITVENQHIENTLSITKMSKQINFFSSQMFSIKNSFSF